MNQEINHGLVDRFEMARDIYLHFLRVLNGMHQYLYDADYSSFNENTLDLLQRMLAKVEEEYDALPFSHEMVDKAFSVYEEACRQFDGFLTSRSKPRLNMIDRHDFSDFLERSRVVKLADNIRGFGPMSAPASVNPSEAAVSEALGHLIKSGH